MVEKIFHSWVSENRRRVGINSETIKPCVHNISTNAKKFSSLLLLKKKLSVFDRYFRCSSFLFAHSSSFVMVLLLERINENPIRFSKSVKSLRKSFKLSLFLHLPSSYPAIKVNDFVLRFTLLWSSKLSCLEREFKDKVWSKLHDLSKERLKEKKSFKLLFLIRN